MAFSPTGPIAVNEKRAIRIEYYKIQACEGTTTLSSGLTMTRNLLLVTVDSLRADHCGFLGDDRGLTPTLDELADGGVVFEHALAPGPRTPSSMPVTFTGEFVKPRNMGVYADYEAKSTGWMERQDRIRHHLDRFPTIPQRLREEGYDTAGITANPWTTANTGFDAGFDHFESVTEREDVGPAQFPLAGTATNALNADLDDWLLTWPDFYDLVLDARDRLTEPYFLWVFLLDPHQPYLTPGRYRTENSAPEMYYANLRYNKSFGYTDDLPSHLDVRLRRAYRDTVRSTDAFVNKLMTDLADDDPAVVFHADHGEAFGEHGAYGHRLQLYRENLHVPLLVHGTEASDRVADPVALRDLPALVTEAATAGASFDPSSLTRSNVVSRTEEGERVGLRDDRWTYVEADSTFESYMHDYRTTELYDRSTDPDENTDLSADRPEARSILSKRLAQRDSHRRECDRVGLAVADLHDRV